MIHAHTNGDLLAYTTRAGITPPPPTEEVPGMAWSAPYAVLRHDTGCLTQDQLQLLQLVRRMYKGETLCLQEWPDGEFYAGPWHDLLQMAGTGQLLVLRPLCDLLEASPDELMTAMAGETILFPSTMRMQAANMHAGRDPLDPVGGIAWRYRGKVLGWALQQHHVATHPVSHAMGYRDSVVRRMEPKGAPFTPETPPQAIDALQAVRRFVDHVDVAVKCALDTPQPITLDIHPGQLVFENVRLSPSIRGLRVRLPTGGALFYREAAMVPGIAVPHHKGRPMPRRRVPMDIAYQLAADMVIRTIHDDCYGGAGLPRDTAVVEFGEWLETSPL